jgi:hypothetical protein
MQASKRRIGNRLAACLTVLALILGLAPMSALADGEVNSLDTLEAAILAAPAGGTVQLTGDVVFTDGVLEIDKNLTLDLNGFTLSGSEPSNINKVIVVKNGATFTLDDTSASKSGRVVSTDAGTQPRVISVESGALTLKGGIITATGNASAYQGVYLAENCGLTMTGGQILMGETAGFSMGVNLKGSGSSFTLKTGTVACPKGNAVSTSAGTAFTMTGGTLDSGTSARPAVAGGMGATDIQISGGKITGNKALGPGMNNTTVISGDVVMEGDISATSSDLTISGGTFNGAITANANRTSITGGNFAQNPTDYVSESGISVAGLATSDGTRYYAGAPQAVAQALAAGAQAGDTVDVLKGDLTLDMGDAGVVVKNSGGGQVVVDNVEVPVNGQQASHACTPGETWHSDADEHWKTCAVCQSKVENTAQAHSFGAWTTVQAPQVGTPGVQQRTCSICQYVQQGEIEALKSADYTQVDAAIAKAEALDASRYVDFSAVKAAIQAVQRGKDESQQAAVDGYAQAILTALEKLQMAYRVTEGAGGMFVQGSGQALRFVCDGPHDQLTGVLVDGKIVDPSRYQTASGSTVLTLSADYLQTLSVGKHVLRLQFQDGYAEAAFSVRLLPADTGSSVPRTGDVGGMGLWALLLLAAGGLAVSLVRRGSRHSA